LTGVQEARGEEWSEMAAVAAASEEEEEDEELEEVELRRRFMGLVLGRTGTLKNAWFSVGGFILLVVG
jgi:hypothetical protein